jgi:hypothetical protein
MYDIDRSPKKRVVTCQVQSPFNGRIKHMLSPSQMAEGKEANVCTMLDAFRTLSMPDTPDKQLRVHREMMDSEFKDYSLSLQHYFISCGLIHAVRCEHEEKDEAMEIIVHEGLAHLVGRPYPGRAQ